MEIVNKVSESGILSLDLETFFPKEEIVSFDLKEYLFMELILKEKDFRKALQEKNWNEYNNKNAAVFCSTDSIIPVWAYMLVASYLQPIARNVVFGNVNSTKEKLLLQNIEQIEISEYDDKRIVVKGCGEESIPESAYLLITKLLRPVAKSIMYGEPCSTVPIFKKSISKI